MMRIVIYISIALAITGCSHFTENPYSDFVVSDINETTEQSPAVILVGDPQVSSRESLINDRMREVDHLEEMINESKDVTFEPQLKRDLRVIRSLAAQLGISFNPASGAAFDRQEELNKLRTDFELAQLCNELETLKKSSQAISGDGSNSSPGQNNPQPAPSDPSVAGIKAQLEKAINAADALINELKTTAAEKAADASIKISPEDHFEDLNAYRARLRQRQNEVRLDDVHDADGHALYRLQLSAAVLPGKVKNKFAVLDVGISPTQTNDDEIRTLYEQWLFDLSLRNIRLALSSTKEYSRVQSKWTFVEHELVGQGLLQRELIDIIVRPKASDRQPKQEYKFIVIPVFVYPDEKEFMKIAREKGYLLTEAAHELRSLVERNGFVRPLLEIKQFKEGGCEIFAATPNSNALLKNYDNNDVTYAEVYKLAKSVADSASSIKVLRLLHSVLDNEAKGGDDSLADLIQQLDWLNDLEDSAVSIFEIFKSQSATSGQSEDNCFSQVEPEVPKKFKTRVSMVDKQDSNKIIWKGNARTYQAQPTERVQRISSVASAVNSMQTALSLAAMLPGQGLGLNTGAAAAKTAIGMTEAIERTPLIIGYTDRQPETGARFGYLFGPRAVLNTKDNRLEYKHQARNYPVFADITVPVWWPSISLNVRSAWVENWHSGTEVFKKKLEAKQIKVKLRPRLTDANPLTQVVLGNPLISDFDVPRITKITPKLVSMCGAEQITFTIAGDNLWRAPVVYLRGKRHDSLRILPDMKGLEVTFDMDELPDPPYSGLLKDKITVWTTLGSTEWDSLEIVDSRLGVPCRGADSLGGLIAVLKPASSRIIGGEDQYIRVNMTTPLPRVARNIRVIYQFLTHEGYGQKQNIDDTDVSHGKYAEGNVSVSKPDHMPSQEAEEGPLVRVGLEFQAIDGGEYHSYWAETPVVYYMNKAASSFRVDTEKIHDFNDEIIITPPVKLSNGYPKFQRRKNNFVAEIENMDDVGLSADADWNHSEHTGKVVVSVTFKDENSKKEFLKQACTKETNLTISTSDRSEASPQVDKGSVIIAKQTDGCT